MRSWVLEDLAHDCDGGFVTRCLLNIWGTMLFLRLTWVIGQCGIWQVSKDQCSFICMIIKTSKLCRFWRKSTRAWWWSLLATSSPVCPLCPCRQSQPMDRSQLAVFTTWSPGSSLSEEVNSIIKFNLRALGPAIGGSIGIMFTVSVFARIIFFLFWVLSLPWKGGEHCLRWNVHNWFCYLCQWSHAGDFDSLLQRSICGNQFVEIKIYSS